MEEKKILFITTTFIFKKELEGIKNKLIAQKQAMENLGLKVDFVSVDEPYKVFLNGLQILDFKNHFLFSLSFFIGLLRKLRLEHYQYVYIRNPLVFDQYGFIKFLKRNSSSYILLEFPTYPFKKERISIYQMATYYSMYFMRKLYKNYINVILYSGNKVDNIYGIRAIQIKHSANLKKYQISDSHFDIEKVNFILVASFAKWHGIERLLEGLKRYITHEMKNGPKVHLFLIGYNEPLFAKFKSFVIKNSLEKYITMPGALQGKELDSYFDRANIGIGSLGMHRIGLFEGSPLKTAEYAARGVPFVVGYKDSNFYDKKYCFQIPADESPVDIVRILNWYSKLSIDKEAMRKFAVSNFSWEVQFKSLFNL